MSQVIEKLTNFYKEFSLNSLVDLTQIYAKEVVFVDPLHRIEGVDRLARYFEASMRGMTACSFEFDRTMIDDDAAFLEWRMIYRHPRLRRGEELLLNGTSLVKFCDKITYHRDYYDAGQLFYEHVPLMGSVLSVLKKRIAR